MSEERASKRSRFSAADALIDAEEIVDGANELAEAEACSPAATASVPPPGDGSPRSPQTPMPNVESPLPAKRELAEDSSRVGFAGLNY
jgi:hypothetical protein